MGLNVECYVAKCREGVTQFPTTASLCIYVMVIFVTWQSIPTLKSWFPLLFCTLTTYYRAAVAAQEDFYYYYSSKVKLSYFPLIHSGQNLDKSTIFPFG